MRILLMGINKSTQIKENQGYGNWESNSPSDRKINGALKELGLICKRDFKFTDVINLQTSNSKFKEMTEQEKLKLCEENKETLLKEINEFNPDCLIFLFKTDFVKGFTKFYLEPFKKIIKKPIIRIKHPRYVTSYKKNFMSVKEYAEYIKLGLKEMGVI